jgi:iron complex transport system substrate-binding protein
VSTLSLFGDIIRETHGESVAGVSPEPGPFPLRRLVQLDPEVYLATSDSGRTLKGLRAQPGTKGLRAIRSGRFDIVSTAVVTPGPKVGQALVEIARILHPNAFR